MSDSTESKAGGAIPTFPFRELPPVAEPLEGMGHGGGVQAAHPDYEGLRVALQQAVRALRSFEEYVGVLERHRVTVSQAEADRKGCGGAIAREDRATPLADPVGPPREVFPVGQWEAGPGAPAALSAMQKAQLDQALAMAFATDGQSRRAEGEAGNAPPISTSPFAVVRGDVDRPAAVLQTDAAVSRSPFTLDPPEAPVSSVAAAAPQPAPAPASLIAAAPPLPPPFSPFGPALDEGAPTPQQDRHPFSGRSAAVATEASFPPPPPPVSVDGPFAPASSQPPACGATTNAASGFASGALPPAEGLSPVPPVTPPVAPTVTPPVTPPAAPPAAPPGSSESSSLPFSPFQGLEPVPPPPEAKKPEGAGHSREPNPSTWPTSPFFGASQATTAPFRVVEPPPVILASPTLAAPAPTLPPLPPLPAAPAVGPASPQAAPASPFPPSMPPAASAPTSHPPPPPAAADQGQAFNFAELLRANGQR